MKNTDNKKTAILTMGLPGAGKSYVVDRNYNTSEFTIIDPDAIKEEKEDYNPKQPEIYHEWSKKEAKARTAKAVTDNENLIIDGTGTNSDKMVKQIVDLQSQGYTVTVLYVKVSLATALARNASRERNVPEEIIYEKYSLISTSFEILSGYADVLKVICND